MWQFCFSAAYCLQQLVALCYQQPRFYCAVFHIVHLRCQHLFSCVQLTGRYLKMANQQRLVKQLAAVGALS